MVALLAAACRVGDPGAPIDAGDAADGPGGDAAAVDAPGPIVDARAIDAPAIDADVHACPAATPPTCAPGPGTGEGDQCHDGPSCYLARVQAAVNGTIAAHPAWFRWDDAIPCWIILDVDHYLDAVVADLTAHGLCAIRDPNAPGEEVTVKHDNAFTENFDIVASTGCARSGAPIYTGWCAPAWW